MNHFQIELSTASAVRTLLAAGFTISNSRRQPRHIEIYCERMDIFGSIIPYIVALCESEEPPPDDIQNIINAAKRDGRVLVIVAKMGGDSWISWIDFLEGLGGAVPSWRALGSEYPDVLRSAGRNLVPPGMTGQAWQIYEDAVADGLEFIFGRRVVRLGGKKRGRRVSDMIAQTPDYQILVIDAKASTDPYDVTWPNLRPFIEYTLKQKLRQTGQLEVGASILVAQEFLQDSARLIDVAGEFLSETGVPLGYLRSELIIEMIKQLSSKPYLRNAIKWSKLFRLNGQVNLIMFTREIEQAEMERYPHESLRRRDK